MRRRLVVGGLVLASLVLITVSFRAAGAGGVQETGASVLRPLQVGVERVASPFRDAWRWFDGLRDARAEAERLRAELARARQEAAQYADKASRVDELERVLDFRGLPDYPRDFDRVTTTILVYPGPFDRSLVIAAGENDGVQDDAPVITPDGLVGRVVEVSPDTAKVTTLVGGSNDVWAEVQGGTRARGVLRGRPGSDTLSLSFVKEDERVRKGDRVVTAGSQEGARLESLYPRGIPIGTVTYASQSSTDVHWRIQVKPFVDFDALRTVIVLVPLGERGR